MALLGLQVQEARPSFFTTFVVIERHIFSSNDDLDVAGIFLGTSSRAGIAFTIKRGGDIENMKRATAVALRARLNPTRRAHGAPAREVL